MIDTPVFGFFHRARPPPAQPTHAVDNEVAGGHADEPESSAPEAESPDPSFPQCGQAPAPVLQQVPHPVPTPAPVCQPAGAFTKASVAAESLGADQLGLAHPFVITRVARV